jgi:hypothetical protein
MADTEALDQALIDFGLALMLDEDPALAATEPDDGILIRKATEWFANRKTELRGILCDDGRPKAAVTASTTVAIAALLKLSGHFPDHFPAQAAANAIVTFGLAKFCAGGIPAKN